jgi:hypothetical protein
MKPNTTLTKLVKLLDVLESPNECQGIDANELDDVIRYNEPLRLAGHKVAMVTSWADVPQLKKRFQFVLGWSDEGEGEELGDLPDNCVAMSKPRLLDVEGEREGWDGEDIGTCHGYDVQLIVIARDPAKGVLAECAKLADRADAERNNAARKAAATELRTALKEARSHLDKEWIDRVLKELKVAEVQTS